MPKRPWLNVDDYLTYQPPNTDRSTWTKSNFWLFGSSSFKGNDFPHKEFDSSKCKVCGGTGRSWEIRDDLRGNRRGIKRSIPCPENCEYTVKW